LGGPSSRGASIAKTFRFDPECRAGPAGGDRQKIEQEENMPLQLGFWAFNANGYNATLNIASVDPQGNVTGTLTFGTEIPSQLNNVAVWNDTAQVLTFIRIPNPADPSTFQIYTGYLFQAEVTQPNSGQMLAGSFIAFPGSGGSASRSVFGWFAQFPIPEVIG
jgi:hypothetical protein